MTYYFFCMSFCPLEERRCYSLTIKDEAVARMRLLDLFPAVIEEFEQKNILNKSESPLGALYWLTDDEKKLVQDFEKEYSGILVYHLIKTYTRDFGIVYDLLYVSDSEETWNIDKEFLRANLVMSHTVTADAESGRILIK